MLALDLLPDLRNDRRSRPHIVRAPSREESRFAAELRILLRGPLSRSVEHVLPRIERLRTDALRADQDPDPRAIARAAASIFQREIDVASIRRVTVRALERVDAHSEQETETIIRIVRVDPLRSERGVKAQLQASVRESVELIEGIPEKFFDDLTTELVDGVQKGRPPELIAKRMREGFLTEADDDGALAKAIRRCDTIARDEVGTLHGNLSRIRQTNIGIRRFRWITSRDERVRGNPAGHYPDARPSHFAREGKIYFWELPPEDGIPGAPFNCRCIAEPVIEDLLDDEGASIAEEGEPIFTFDPLAFL